MSHRKNTNGNTWNPLKPRVEEGINAHQYFLSESMRSPQKKAGADTSKTMIVDNKISAKIHCRGCGANLYFPVPYYRKDNAGKIITFKLKHSKCK